MLRHTFIHLTRIGEPTEWRLWRAGLTGWDDVLTPGAAGPAGLGPRRWDLLRDEVEQSVRRWDDGDVAFFADRLRPAHAWRLFAELHRQAVYLDIETDGGTEITAVVVHRADGPAGRTLLFVRDENLHELPMHLAGAKLLVTYNGRCFDWPMLRAAFANLPPLAAHLDLRYPYARLQYRGGLKGVERAIGLRRPDELADIDGASAVWLWHRHLRGDRRAMPALLRYCAEDVLNLKFLAEWIHNRLAGGLPFPVPLFENPSRASCDSLPSADPDLMDLCRRELADWPGY